MTDSSPSNLGRPDPPQPRPRTQPKPQPQYQTQSEPESQSQSQPPSLGVNIPVEIGGYRIQRVLGSGGMATVYAALQKQPRRTVALKVMKAGVSMTHGDVAFRRFKREIEILGKLHHPCIAQVYEAGMHNDGGGGDAVPFFVMEYISGAKTILEYVAAKQLDVRDRLKLFVKICAAVEHGHRNKVIHRDLKPGNILIDQYGEPKIIDFGVAQASDMGLSSQTMHTEVGRLVGTLQYMAPEQVDTALCDLDPRCDVYALGALLYKMLTGKPAHDLEGRPLLEAVRIIREETPVPPGQIKPEVRGDLETIILKAMERDRARRYKHAGSLGRDIVRYLMGKPIHARRASLMYRARLFGRRHRTVLTATGAMAIVMALAAGFVIIERIRMREHQRQGDLQRTEQERLHERELQQGRAAGPTSSSSSWQNQQPYTLQAHTAQITRLAFLPIKDRLASTSFDHSLVIWDLQAQQPLATVKEFDGPVMHMAVNGDGSRIAAATEHGPILLIDAATGKVLRTIRTPFTAITSLALSPDANRIAYGGDDLTLRLRTLDSAQEFTFRGTTGAFTCVAFSADGGLIAAGSQKDDVHVWNVKDGNLVQRLGSGLEDEIAAVGFVGAAASGGGGSGAEAIVWVSADGAATLWKQAVESGAEDSLEHFAANNGVVVDVSIDPSGRWLACAKGDSINIWNLAANKPPHQAGPALRPPETIYAVAIDPAGQWCAAGLVNGDVMVMPVTQGR